MNKILFSERLREQRKKCGYGTINDLARKYNETFPAQRKDRKDENQSNYSGILGTLKNYENPNKKCNPRLDIVDNLCKLLSCNIDYLVGNIGFETHDSQFIHDKTGLSEASIKELEQLNAETAAFKDSQHDLDTINTLISQLDHKNNSIVHWITTYIHSKGLEKDFWYYTESGTILPNNYKTTEPVIHMEKSSDTFDNLILMGLENRIKALKTKSSQ